MKYFTGIGSRKTYRHILEHMTQVASELCNTDYVLRSGGADGADSAFEKGCDNVNGKKEIYLPWKYFNKNPSNLYEIPKEAFNLASTLHPTWDYLSQGAQKLHARNCQQVLGKDLKTPSNFVICWTDGGKVIGGTATAIKLAYNNNIPVINMFNNDWQSQLEILKCMI